MNWAHRIIKFTPEIDPYITSPLIVKNEFFDPEFNFIFSPFQWENPKDEWSFSKVQTLVASGSVRLPFLYKRFLKKKIKKINPDVIHVHFGNIAWQYSDLAEELNIPLIATFHGYDYQMVLKKKPIYKFRYLQLFQRAKFITSGGTNARDYLISIGSSKDQTRRIPMAIDTKKIPFTEKSKEKGHLHLLQISSFSEKKGHLYTLRAFLKARQQYPNIKLTFIGEFVDKALLMKVKSIINDKRITNSVKIYDSMPYQDLLKKLPEYDVFIHPSVTSEEGDTECTPVSIMDAQCAGLPVISTFHADIPDLVIPNKTGILVPEKDVNKLAEAILVFAQQNTEELRVWRNSAREFILNKYDIRSAGEQWRRLYQEAKQSGFKYEK